MLNHVIELSMTSGGVLFVMPVLLLLALAVLIERGAGLARSHHQGQQAIEQLAGLSQLEREPVQRFAEGLSAPFAPLPAALLTLRHWDHAGAERVLQEALMRQAPTLDRRLWVLDTVVTLAPLLGLLGTILGMFHAFKVLGAPGTAPTAVTGGVAEALVATACGLFIAIIGLLAYNGLQERVRRVMHDLETLKTMLINRIDGLDLRSSVSAVRPATADLHAARA